MDMDSLLCARSLYKSFAGKQVLNDIDVDIYPGDLVTIIGRSGQGKSVLLKILSMLDYPDSGSIVFDGIDVLSASMNTKQSLMGNSGYLFQGDALFESLNIWQNIGFKFIYVDREKRQKVIDKVIASLEMVDLDPDIIEYYPKELSGGMRRRVALARAIVTKPSIMFLDEPTTGLDPITSRSIEKLIGNLRELLNATVIVVTHDMKSVMNIASRVIVVESGKIAWTGKPNDMHQSSDNCIVSKFVVAG